MVIALRGRLRGAIYGGENFNMRNENGEGLGINGELHLVCVQRQLKFSYLEETTSI